MSKIYFQLCLLTWMFILSNCNGAVTGDFDVPSLPHCSPEHNNLISSIIYVSTLDGRISALDAKNNGKILWSLDTGEEMLSSTIQNRELTNSGHWVRMIPSLEGSLYKFDGETIDLVPITADQLLTSSFKYSDDLIFSGGKETSTFGISMPSGRLLYKCGVKGCINETKTTAQQKYSSGSSEEVLVIQKRLQTVYAIAPESGTERWNFSVGQHDLKVVQNSQCQHWDKHDLDLSVRVVVPEGLVYAVSSERPDQVLWQNKLNSPIVNVWQWKEGELKTVDIFSDSQWTWGQSSPNYKSPRIYVGMHNKQLYIQESATMHKLANSYAHHYKQQLIGSDEAFKVPRIPWKPFPVASSAVEIFAAKADAPDVSNALETQLVERTATSLAVLYSTKYINGNGFFLYTDADLAERDTVLCDKLNETNDDDAENIDLEDETPVQIIIVSLWYWWREVLIISITAAISLNVLFPQRLIGREDIREGVQQQIIVVERPVPIQVPVEIPAMEAGLVRNSSESNEFISRFLTDFDVINCLGKGGFGMVFEARNKIDECNYAVKRINLPNRPESRERVMREVKALAKLDHRNIVRYFNAWLEFPPADFNLEVSTNFEETDDDVLSYTISHCSLAEVAGETAESQDDQKDDDSFIVFESNGGGDTGKTDVTEKSQNSQMRTDGNGSVSISISEIDHQVHQPVVNITRMYLYIQMQLCQKESLKDWMCCNQERDCLRVKTIFEQILSAVEYVHLQGLMHRDLKPSNIFFSLDGEIKVGDFGLVTDMADDETVKLCDNTILTKNTSHRHTKEVGTQLYMSPEQRKGAFYNYKVDIYSLGVILFELLMPFCTEMERHKTLSNLRTNVFPDGFASKFQDEHDLLQMMLAPVPELRPTTFGVRARPPFLHSHEHSKWHFELPPRRS